MAISNAFVWGKGGAQLTPEQIARQREIEDALLQRGVDTSPVGSAYEGLARVANAAAGSFRRGRLIRAERDNKAYDDQAFNTITGLLAGGSPSATVPMTGAATEVGAVDPAKVDMSGNQIYGDFIDTVKTGITNPFGLAAVAATGKAESGYSPGNVNRTWSDPSESGQPGTAGGIMSWRGPRLAALQAAGDMSPAGQAKFFLQEDPALITALNNAKSLDEAQGLMNRAWAFRGYDRPGGEAGRRLSLASGFLPSFQGQGGGTQVASLDPAAGMPKPDAAAAIEATAPGSGYVDPQVTTDYRQAAPAAVETAALPPLPSRDVAPAPAVAAAPPVQVAQTAPPVVTAPNGAPIPPEVLKVLSDPRISQRTRGIAELLIKQQQARQQAIMEQQLKQADPAYQADLRLKNAQYDQIANPRISPADQARIDLDKTKFATEQENRKTLTAAEQADVDAQNERLKFDREKFEREVDKGQWQKLTDGRLYNQTTGEFRDAPPAVPGSVPPKFDDISGLRKEIQQLPSYKNLSQALPIYRSMAETAGRSSKASDLNLVYGLGKIMDPTSVVREGEMTMVKNTASWPDWLQGALASLNGGAALTPETREAIMTEAYGRVQGYDSAFKQDTNQYQGIVERNKFNPADVIPDFGTYEPWKPAPAGGAPTAADIPPAPTGVDPEDWKYLTPEQRRLWQK